jgi:hypothetical protein
MPLDQQDLWQNRPYEKPRFEPRQGSWTAHHHVKFQLPPDEYLTKSHEQWMLKYNQMPMSRSERREMKIAKGIPLDPEDYSPKKDTEMRRAAFNHAYGIRDRNDSDDDDGGDYGGSSYNDDDAGGDYGGYDDVKIEAESEYQAPQGMSAEERRQKELEHKISQWERQCSQIEAANKSMQATFERSMNDYEKKHDEWEKTTKLTCTTCKVPRRRTAPHARALDAIQAGKSAEVAVEKVSSIACIAVRTKGWNMGPKASIRNQSRRQSQTTRTFLGSLLNSNVSERPTVFAAATCGKDHCDRVQSWKADRVRLNVF